MCGGDIASTPPRNQPPDEQYTNLSPVLASCNLLMQKGALLWLPLSARPTFLPRGWLQPEMTARALGFENGSAYPSMRVAL